MLTRDNYTWLANWRRDYSRDVARRHPDENAPDRFTTYAEYDETVNVELESLRDYVADLDLTWSGAE